MFHRIQQYGDLRAGGRRYRPRAFADPRPDGRWDGWLVFFPLGGGNAIAPPGPETTQSSVHALSAWAAGLTPVYLEGALVRALTLADPSGIIARLADAEYDALEDSEWLQTAAELERATAALDEASAASARAQAEQTRRERLATEAAIAATEQQAATADAETHMRAARDARATAAAAERRRRSAAAKAATGTGRKRTRTKKQQQKKTKKK